MAQPTETNEKAAPVTPHVAVDEVISRFQTVAERHLQTCFARWDDTHADALSRFRAQLRRCLSAIDQPARPQGMLTPVWQTLDAYFQELETWLSAWDPVSDKTTPPDIWADWPGTFTDWMEAWPGQVRVPVDPAGWQPHPEDTLRIAFWKRLKRLKHRIRRRAPESYRTFPLDAFCRVYLEGPYRVFLVKAWERHLRLVAQDFAAVLRRIPYELGARFLFLDDAARMWRQPDPALVTARAREMAQYLGEVDACIERSASARDEAVERFHAWFDATAARCRYGWSLAGTRMLPETAFGDSLLPQQRQTFDRIFNETRTAWAEFVSAERDDWRHDIALTRVQLHTGLAFFDACETVRAKLTRDIVSVFSTAAEPIDQSLRTLQGSGPWDEQTLRRVIADEKRSLLRTLRRERLPRIVDAVVHAEVHQALQHLQDRTALPVQALPSVHRIVRRRDTGAFPPESECAEIPIKALLNDRYFFAYQSRLKKAEQSLRQNLDGVLHAFSEIDQVVEFNLEAALSLLQEQRDFEEARKTAVEGLERARERIEDAIERCDALAEETLQNAQSATHAYIDEIQDLLDNEKVLEIRLQWARSQAEERYRAYRRRVLAFLRHALPQLWAYAVAGARRLYAQYQRLRRITGFAPAAPADLLQFLTETHQRLAALPYVYQRLFHNEPLTDERFFAGREEELQVMETDFQRWRQGQYMTTAIVGERGSGRTTLLNFARRDVFKTHPVHYIDIVETLYAPDELVPYLKKAFPECQSETLADLETALNGLDPPRICVIENIQNLFLKTVSGFDLLDRFLLLISRTPRKVYWVFSCTLHTWAYLDKVMQISRYFQRVLMLDRLTPDEMEQIIMKRHRVTGYQLEFEVPDSISRSRRFKKLRAQQDRIAYLHRLCFEQLHRVAMGNVSVGMLFWLRAIKKVDGDTLTVDPVIAFDDSSLLLLTADELFTLGAVLQHEILSVKHHALVFRQDEHHSRLLLTLLANKGILMETRQGYRIHPFLYRPVVQALRRRNILH